MQSAVSSPVRRSGSLSLIRDPLQYGDENDQTIAVGEDTSLQHLDIKFDCNMSKASSSHNALYYEDRGWQRRRIVVTAHEILFFKERATRILDVVALHGISRIYFASKEELKRKQIQNERQKLSRKSSMMPTQSRKGSDDRSMDVSSSAGTKGINRCASHDNAAVPEAADKREETIASNQEDTELEFVIETKIDSVNRGRVYHMRADSQQLARSFVDVTLKLQEVADNEYKRKQRLQLVQKQIQAFYTNSYFQSLIVFLILGNIACAIVELQIHPEGQLAFIFYVLDVIFTLAFLIELLLNMAANWFRAFWLSSFNVFDFIVVAITTVSLLPSVDMKVVSSLRLLRALRVVRIFARLGSARRIIMALSAAVIPVCNVLVVVIGTMCVFAILGATAYPNSSRFSTFSNAFFSLFQILCLEGWTIILVDVESSNKNPPVPGKLFFVCYIFLVVFVLIPVFIAAILDGYRTAAFQQSQDELHERHMQALSTETVRMAIDPILEILSQVSNIQQLHARLEVLFALLDLDEGGSLAYEELAAGLRKMNHVTSALTLEEFETIHQGGKYIDAAGKMSLDNFKAAFLFQLRFFVVRKLAQSIMTVGKEDPGLEIVFYALKTLITDTFRETEDPGEHPLAKRLRKLEERIEGINEQQCKAHGDTNAKLNFLIRTLGFNATDLRAEDFGKNAKSLEISTGAPLECAVPAQPRQLSAAARLDQPYKRSSAEEQAVASIVGRGRGGGGWYEGGIELKPNQDHVLRQVPEEPQSQPWRLSVSRGSSGGLGMCFVLSEGQVVIAECSPSGTAAEAGLAVYDTILEIDGTSTEGLSADEITAALRGEPGTCTSLLIGEYQVRPLNGSGVEESDGLKGEEITPGRTIGVNGARLTSSSPDTKVHLKAKRSSPKRAVNSNKTGHARSEALDRVILFLERINQDKSLSYSAGIYSTDSHPHRNGRM